MDHMDMNFLRFLSRRPCVPSWAKAEGMESSIPQIVLWHCDPAHGGGIG